MNYEQIFKTARDKFSKYEGRATQDCHPMDNFDWWIAQEAWNAAIEYIIPFATANYHITAEELRRHKK